MNDVRLIFRLVHVQYFQALNVCISNSINFENLRLFFIYRYCLYRLQKLICQCPTGICSILGLPIKVSKFLQNSVVLQDHGITSEPRIHVYSGIYIHVGFGLWAGCVYACVCLSIECGVKYLVETILELSQLRKKFKTSAFYNV